MGCCSSSFPNNNNKMDINLNDTYVGSPRSKATKRNFSSRISGSVSSGLFSRCTTPSRRSITSRSSSTPSSTCSTPKPKTSNLNLCSEAYGETAQANCKPTISICDDFEELPQTTTEQLLQRQANMDKSYGYFSESMSSGADEVDSSAPSRSGFVRTLDTSESAALAAPPPPSGLEMEMYMMTHSNFMTKTSSPFCQRRDVTFDVPLTNASPASASYQKWRNYLQSTPPYRLHNVTKIPEAMSGLFCPPSFPAYVDLDDMESAPKRYKVDLDATARESEPAARPAHWGLTRTISTEL